MPGTTKLAGKKRSHLPKIPTGFSQTSTTIEDGNDAVAYANLFRGIDPNYAIPRDAINADLRSEGIPFIRLVGDSFAANAESQINLLADLTSLVGSGPLTNNNVVTFVQETLDDESPLWEQTYANFVSASSQYLSLPTASAIQVDTNSFTAGIAFKTTTTGSSMGLFMYGSNVSTKPYWQLYINSLNILIFAYSDGTNSGSIADPIAGRWNDGRWHIATTLFDKTSNTAFLFVDGQLIVTGSISSISGTLTVAGENFYIGGIKGAGGSVGTFFNGSLALFKLINNAADYNIPQVWNMGTREAVSAGTWAVKSNSNNRMNNQFSNTSATTGDYSYCTIVTEDGEYEIQANLDYLSNGGQAQVLIDGNPVTWSTKNAYIDTYNGSTTYNNITKAYGFKLSAGRHTVKLLSNAKNGSSSAFLMQFVWINFIKRRGHELGGITNALLLGDEIVERYTETIPTQNIDTSEYYNSVYNDTASEANGNYREGSLFIKGGLYRIDFIYQKFTDQGKVDLWFGDVQVLSQLDEYNGSLSRSNISTQNVRLQQGRQDIRMASNGKNASSTDYRINIVAIRLERLSD